MTQQPGQLNDSVERSTLCCPDCGEPASAEDQQNCIACGATLEADPLIGRILEDRYEVMRRLGAGAMGAVYEVRHLRLGKRFAMKIIRQALTREPEFAARFEQEALSCSRLSHPNCIAVTDFGQTADGLLYLVMEYLEGRSLADLMDEPMPVVGALRIVRQCLLALQHAHQAGVIHRDIKPENVMIVEGADGSDMAKLVDFGIAKLGQHEARDKRLTGVGVVFGTPEYMAPEQALGSADVDERADLYAVGVILRGLLTGRPLFTADDGLQLLELKLASEPPPLRRVCPGVFSNELQQVVAKALARKPSNRFGSASEFLAAVEAIQAQPGGGLARGGSSTLTRIITLGQSIADIYRDWYHCAGHGSPRWSTRLRALVTTAKGRIVAGTAAAGVVAVALLSLAALPDPEQLPPPPDEIPIATEAGDKRAASRARPLDPTARRLGQARLLLAKYSCREASLDLKNLVREQPELAKAHYLLGAALVCRKRFEEGLAAYGRAIDLDSRYRADARVTEDVGGLFASRSRKLRLLAIDFLAERVGRPARKQLLEACTHRDRRTREAAVAAVIKIGADEEVDWVASYELDLKQLSCREVKRRKLIQRLKALDDPRVLKILKNARGARAGFLGLRQRYGCLRKELARAIAELEKSG